VPIASVRFCFKQDKLGAKTLIKFMDINCLNLSVLVFSLDENSSALFFN
jgi:hypothetical protein